MAWTSITNGFLAIGHGWMNVHRYQADVARLGVVEVVHAPVCGSQPFDDLWRGLVNRLLPRGRPHGDVPGHVRVRAIPEGFTSEPAQQRPRAQVARPLGLLE